MKTGILIAVLLFGVVSGNAQTLKELLYGGKLKKDTSGVIRKNDDLSAKIDTSTKKPEAEKPQTAPVIATGTDSLRTNTVISTDAAVTTATEPAVAVDPAAANTGTTEAGDKPKDNNAVWKSYVEELIGTLKSEVMTNKKVKGGTYSVLIDYAIEVDGQITVNSVSSVPENSYLQDQIRQRLTLTAPQLTPLLGSNGKPRKAAKKQTITLSK
jgi:hypothetical protein